MCLALYIYGLHSWTHINKVITLSHSYVDWLMSTSISDCAHMESHYCIIGIYIGIKYALIYYRDTVRIMIIIDKNDIYMHISWIKGNIYEYIWIYIYQWSVSCKDSIMLWYQYHSLVPR